MVGGSHSPEFTAGGFAEWQVTERQKPISRCKKFASSFGPGIQRINANIRAKTATGAALADALEEAL
jgi:hypothetical protein